MKRILVCVDWFSPGYRAGGITRSALNLVNSLNSTFEIFVVTRNTDFGVDKPFVGVKSNSWNFFDSNVSVFYADNTWLSYSNFRRLVNNIRPDVLYLNSMFSLPFTIYPLLLHKFHDTRAEVVLAPRGMLKSSALRYKKLKKMVFLSVFKSFNFTKGVIFHATDDQEHSDILNLFGKRVSVKKIPDFAGIQPPFEFSSNKLKGSIRLIFIGRIHPIKNLMFLIEVMKKVPSEVVLTVIGKVENQYYWEKCQETIISLPPNCKVIYKGELNPVDIQKELRSNHMLVHPTNGENFGHVIFEALSIGRPVLISDQTPWQHLSENNAGWIVSLYDQKKFVEIIERVALMSNEEFNILCQHSWKFCNKWLSASNLKSQYINLFLSAINEA